MLPDVLLVSVESRKGGVGKTTAALNLARLLLEKRKRAVLFLDIDITCVAVGTALSGGPPHRSQRAELPHWAPTSGTDAQALLRIRVKDAGRWEPLPGQPIQAGLKPSVPLTSSPNRAEP
jgi:hypothetical protein